MKKIAAIVLIILVIGTATAETYQWREGLGPGKPYVGLPEVDLTQEMGYMMFYPGPGMHAENVCQRLYLYLPREDVQIGEGTIYLFTREDGVIWSSEMSNTDRISQRAISDAELEGLLWASGTCFQFTLPTSLVVGKTYYVNMTQGSLISDGGVESPAIGGMDQWRFTVEGEYGVSSMEYRRLLEDGSYEGGILRPQIGDEVHFELKLGGDAVMAALTVSNNSVDFMGTAYSADTEITATVTAENPRWGVLFLDAEGRILDQLEF